MSQLCFYLPVSNTHNQFPSSSHDHSFFFIICFPGYRPQPPLFLLVHSSLYPMLVFLSTGPCVLSLFPLYHQVSYLHGLEMPHTKPQGSFCSPSGPALKGQHNVLVQPRAESEYTEDITFWLCVWKHWDNDSLFHSVFHLIRFTWSALLNKLNKNIALKVVKLQKENCSGSDLLGLKRHRKMKH